VSKVLTPCLSISRKVVAELNSLQIGLKSFGSHLPFSEQWRLELVGTPASGGVGTLFLRRSHVHFDLGVGGNISPQQIHLLG